MTHCYAKSDPDFDVRLMISIVASVCFGFVAGDFVNHLPLDGEIVFNIIKRRSIRPMTASYLITRYFLKAWVTFRFATIVIGEKHGYYVSGRQYWTGPILLAFTVAGSSAITLFRMLAFHKNTNWARYLVRGLLAGQVISCLLWVVKECLTVPKSEFFGLHAVSIWFCGQFVTAMIADVISSTFIIVPVLYQQQNLSRGRVVRLLFVDAVFYMLTSFASNLTSIIICLTFEPHYVNVIGTVMVPVTLNSSMACRIYRSQQIFLSENTKAHASPEPLELPEPSTASPRSGLRTFKIRNRQSQKSWIASYCLNKIDKTKVKPQRPGPIRFEQEHVQWEMNPTASSKIESSPAERSPEHEKPFHLSEGSTVEALESPEVIQEEVHRSTNDENEFSVEPYAGIKYRTLLAAKQKNSTSACTMKEEEEAIASDPLGSPSGSPLKATKVSGSSKMTNPHCEIPQLAHVFGESEHSRKATITRSVTSKSVGQADRSIEHPFIRSQRLPSWPTPAYTQPEVQNHDKSRPGEFHPLQQTYFKSHTSKLSKSSADDLRSHQGDCSTSRLIRTQSSKLASNNAEEENRNGWHGRSQTSLVTFGSHQYSASESSMMRRESENSLSDRSQPGQTPSVPKAMTACSSAAITLSDQRLAPIQSNPKEGKLGRPYYNSERVWLGLGFGTREEPSTYEPGENFAGEDDAHLSYDHQETESRLHPSEH
ncbi:hypothetical protein IE53DRAFT_366322 [Violaceomyces palustris]|uniref:Uncharacterized protein n=1 Tax=Violaceomyces palustris TaxID=1673888 RepID=A0ACD0P5U7_9BASI|nr:hypothetical protein IE53DRAFT_366322 [Violaceomyces palustris]